MSNNSANDRLNGNVRSSLITGVILLIVTLSFLFELDWMFLGPVLIILAGIGVLINARLPSE